MNKRKHIHTISSWTAVILWMVLIFMLSSQIAEESSQLSTGITETIIKTIEKIIPNVDLDVGSLNHIVRKNAHFIAYLVLGVLTLNALRRRGVYGYRSFVFALGICILYAISDEGHQLFVPGRGGQARDVILDSAGAGVGIGVYLLICKLFNRKI